MQKKLSEMKYKETGLIKEISGISHDLSPRGIRVGKMVEMVTKQPVKGPVVVVTGEIEVAIGLEMASEIIVEIVETNDKTA
jgi:ferrous iron transport protein A